MAGRALLGSGGKLLLVTVTSWRPCSGRLMPPAAASPLKPAEVSNRKEMRLATEALLGSGGRLPLGAAVGRHY